jgi:DNA-binding HxlR family transcriptional regulator
MTEFPSAKAPLQKTWESDLHDESYLAISLLMRRKSFAEDCCPVARTLDRVGDPWSMLILRDAGFGAMRFDQFQESLGIAPNMLSRRLESLVDAGLLERRVYSERPLRHEYVLTARGVDFLPVLQAFKAFGERHYPRTTARPKKLSRAAQR